MPKYDVIGALEMIKATKSTADARTSSDAPWNREYGYSLISRVTDAVRMRLLVDGQWSDGRGGDIVMSVDEGRAKIRISDKCTIVAQLVAGVSGPWEIVNVSILAGRRWLGEAHDSEPAVSLTPDQTSSLVMFLNTKLTSLNEQIKPLHPLFVVSNVLLSISNNLWLETLTRQARALEGGPLHSWISVNAQPSSLKVTYWNTRSVTYSTSGSGSGLTVIANHDPPLSNGVSTETIHGIWNTMMEEHLISVLSVERHRVLSVINVALPTSMRYFVNDESYPTAELPITYEATESAISVHMDVLDITISVRLWSGDVDLNSTGVDRYVWVHHCCHYSVLIERLTSWMSSFRERRSSSDWYRVVPLALHVLYVGYVLSRATRDIPLLSIENRPDPSCSQDWAVFGLNDLMTAGMC